LGLNGSSWHLTGEKMHNKKLYYLHNKKLYDLHNKKLYDLHNKKLYDLRNSPGVLLVIKSREVGWAWHVASMEARSGSTGIWCGTRS
jgi:hypothetical protein